MTNFLTKFIFFPIFSGFATPSHDHTGQRNPGTPVPSMVHFFGLAMLQDQCEYHAHTHDAHTDIISSPGAPVGAKNVPRYTREQWLLEVLLPKPKILKLCTKFLIRSNILGILVYPRQCLPDVP